jgi:hypothetical protein
MLAERGRLLISGTGDVPSECRPALVTLDPGTLRAIPSSPRRLPGSAASALASAAAGLPGVCLAAFDADRLWLAHVSDAAEDPFRSSGRLRAGDQPIAAAPVGGRACAALIRSRDGAHDALVQLRADGARQRRIRLPPDIRATALFHCRRHILVLASRGTHRRRSLVVAVVR